MTEQELIGIIVLVHPQTCDDSHMRIGEIGTIIFADIRKDDFLVQFDDNSKAFYRANALIIPKSADRIYDYAIKHEANISYNFRQVLADYACHIEYYGAEAQKGALKLVLTNKDLKDFFTDSLEGILETKPIYNIGR